MENQEKCTIYLLTNVVNGKIYIGQTWESPLEKRMGKDGKQYSNSLYIFGAIQKYGVASFKYTILAECNTQEEADKLEIENIIKYNSRSPNIGYNLKEGGSHGKHSEETKEKIGIGSKNRERSEKEMEFITNLGYMWKDKERGPHTQEWKENNSKFMIKRHKQNGHPMLGKHHTEETKQKISEAGKGRVMAREGVERGAEKRKMPKEKEQGIIKAYQEGVAISTIGKIFDTGASSIYRVLKRNNIAIERPHDTWTGKKHSEETKQKMSKTRTKYWNNK